MKTFLSVALLFLTGLCACSEHRPPGIANTIKESVMPPRKEAAVSIDTAASFRIGLYWITPDSLFDFNTVIKTGKDTLHLVACQRYIIEPFGPTANKAQLQASLLKGFSAKTKYVKQENGTFPLVTLRKGNNRLILYFSTDPEELIQSNILKGEINDSSVVFINGVRVGMQARDFYKQFFKSFPLALQRQYKTVIFDYCVDDIRHIYDFKDGKIAAVKFSHPEGVWKLDY